MLIEKDCAFLLHKRPYRDHSVIAHFLTQKNGKVSLVVTGIKSEKSHRRALLRNGHKLSISYSLKSNLGKLIDIESAHEQYPEAHIAYFMLYQYTHELLLALLPEQLPLPTVFDSYITSLLLFADDKPHAALRYLEVELIEQFGGLPDLSKTVDTGDEIRGEDYYYFDAEQGVSVEPQWRSQQQWSGMTIIAFRTLITEKMSNNYCHTTETIAQTIKPLTTYLIDQLLDGKKLHTRSIYRDLQHYT